MKIKPKHIKDELIINRLINLDEAGDNKCDKETFIWLFGKIGNKENRCNPYDYITIPPNSYGPKNKRNKNAFTTTVGRFFFNKLFVENSTIFNVIPYINEPLHSGNIKKIIKKISYATLEDDMLLEDGKEFFDKFQWLTTMIMIIAKHDSEESIEILNKINKKKDEYLKKYAKELENGDESVMIIIENELLKYGEEICKDSDMYDMYESGLCSFKNHFKDLYVIKGMAKDPNPNNGYHFITNSYMEGMNKESYASLTRTQSSGPYARGSLTQTGGAMEKQFIRAFQHIKVEKDTDCGTKKYIEILLNNNNVHKFMYNYIIEGNKLVLLTSKNVDKYINKNIKLRFSSTCRRTKNGNICNKCMGELPFLLGDVENVGLLTSNIGSSCKNSQMKAFHDGQVSTNTMNISKVFNL